MNTSTYLWRRRGISNRSLNATKVLCFFLLLPAAQSAAADQKAEQRSTLDFEIESFKVENGDIEDALRLLRDKDPLRILIGFEEIPQSDGTKDTNISLELHSASVRQILQRLCQMDGRYEYEVAEKVVINVFPKGAKTQSENLLNMRINQFYVENDIFPQNLVNQISILAPELREHLEAKAHEWAKKRGLHLGYPGAIMSGNAPVPRVNLNLKNLTVREILNQITLSSLELVREGRLLGLGPTGWKYEFAIDEKAPTGLGGFPRWSSF